VSRQNQSEVVIHDDQVRGPPQRVRVGLRPSRRSVFAALGFSLSLKLQERKVIKEGGGARTLLRNRKNYV